jgi:hypothetical protein
MAKPHKKRVKVKKLKHNLKDKHIKTRIRGRGFEDDEPIVTNSKKIKKQPIKKVEVKKDTKKRKK